MKEKKKELHEEVGFSGDSMVKYLPAKQETQVWSLGQEDALREGNGNPLQYSCWENPTDRGAWRAIYGPGSRKELNTT